MFRDVEGFQDWYEAISVIEYSGRLSPTGESEGQNIHQEGFSGPSITC